MIRKLLLGVMVLVVAALLLATRQPDTFSVERRLVMNAPPERVFAQINDFHASQAWSPWAKKDPEMKATYSGPVQGVGAVYELSLIHIPEPTRLRRTSYSVFCLKKKKTKKYHPRLLRPPSHTTNTNNPRSSPT